MQKRTISVNGALYWSKAMIHTDTGTATVKEDIKLWRKKYLRKLQETNEEYCHRCVC